MKKVFLLVALIGSLLFPALKAQEVTVAWSEKQLYDNAKDGFFDHFIGSNSKYVFAKFNNLARKPRKMNRKIKIVAFEKASMQKVADVSILGFKENADAKDKYIGLDYYKSVVFEDIIYVFFKKYSRNKEELYVQTFDSKLSPLKEIKKIYELGTDPKSGKSVSMFVMGNKKKGDERIVVGGEIAGGKNAEDVKVEYKLLNKDFSFAAANQVTLPLTVSGRAYGLTSSYEFGDDGNLHVKSNVVLSKEERKNLSKGESSSYPIFSVIDLVNGKIKTHAFKFDKKNIFDSGFKVDGAVTKIYAFFCDIEKDPRGNATHGIMYATLNNQTFEVDNVNFSYFTKPQLDKLFAKDKEDKKKGKTAFKSKKKAQSDEESLAYNYVIEDVQSIDPDNLVLFCSRMNNYAVTSCDNKGNCHTTYYCEKANVTAFKIGKDGSIAWASNLDRAITYSGTDVYDIWVIHQPDKFFVTYGSSFMINSEKKNFSSRKRGSYASDRFEYAVFDYATGNFTKKEYKVNDLKTKSSEKKAISPLSIRVIDNELYTNYEKVRPKGWAIGTGAGAAVLGSVLFFSAASTLGGPTPNAAGFYGGGCLAYSGCTFIWLSYLIGDLKHGEGFLGKIEPMK